jgi:hypothetical protein
VSRARSHRVVKRPHQPICQMQRTDTVVVHREDRLGMRGEWWLMLIGGTVRAMVESFIDGRISQGMLNLGEIASALTKKDAKDAQQPLTMLAQALRATAEAFAEFVRGSRGRAKSTLAFRLGLVLFLVAAGLAVVDHSVVSKNAPHPPTSTGSTTTTATTRGTSKS